MLAYYTTNIPAQPTVLVGRQEDMIPYMSMVIEESQRRTERVSGSPRHFSSLFSVQGHQSFEHLKRITEFRYGAFCYVIFENPNAYTHGLKI